MRIGVVGSREGFSKKEVFVKLSKIIDLEYDELITGGAKGIDTYAEQFFQENNLRVCIIRPLKKDEKIYYLYRNIEIITKSDVIIAFWNGKSRGTKFVIDYASSRGKEVIVINKNITF